MNCNAKTMLKVAAALGAPLALAYFALPGAQAFIVASAPILLALICPVSMLIMMFVMKDVNGRKTDGKTGSANPEPPTGAHGVGIDKA